LLFARIGDRRTTFIVRFGLGLGMLQPIFALIAASTGPAPLYIAFIVMGIVSGFLEFSFVNWVIMYATPDQRPIYSGLFNTVYAVALLLAPIPGGMLVEALGYEAIFIVALLSVIAAFFVSIRYVEAPENRSKTESA
ncbi:MAG: MFS transporter, partial [Anaerolineae bacterium]|nr:MFS transporter [Anaerolineae bacterium]